MSNTEKIKLTEEFVRNSMEGYDSGHDWFHVDRVRRIALYINSCEQMADPFIVEVAALLHDVVDSKFIKHGEVDRMNELTEFLDKSYMGDIMEQIIHVIKNVSFSKKNKSGNIDDPVLLIIQDADRIDALGAIGIARAFNYGGFRGNTIFNPENEKSPTTIGHFYEKLLKLKDLMNTSTGKKLAIERHSFLERYLEQFYSEWDFNINK
jgi:uncharacterized protein